jgi:hypothetical protein
MGSFEDTGDAESQVFSVTLDLAGQTYTAHYVVERGIVRADLAGRIVTAGYVGDDPRGFVKALLEEQVLSEARDMRGGLRSKPIDDGGRTA